MGAWVRAIWMISAHLGCIAGFFFFSWKAVFVGVFIYWITGGLGICLGFHRLLTHRSFQCPKWFEYFLTVCGILALQGSQVYWVASHRAHHLYSDQEGDPHSPRKGFWWSHCMWLFDTKWLSTDDLSARFAGDLLKDPGQRFIEKFQLVPIVLLGMGLIALGWEYFVWGFVIRMVVCYHGTWFVNSASHIWGYQNYDSGDDSKNLWWVALLSFGEGWHNNHHAFQSSARHGLRWWEVDTTFITIKFLSLLGLAKNVQVPKEVGATS